MRRSARTDLCGGRPAMIVPTATPKEIGPHQADPFFQLRDRFRALCMMGSDDAAGRAALTGAQALGGPRYRSH